MNVTYRLLHSRLPGVFFGELRVFAPHLLDEAVVPARLDDPVELGAVIRRETDPFDLDVVDHPSVAANEEAVVRRHLDAVLGDDFGADGSEVAAHALAAVHDLLAAVELDLGNVGALEEVTEEPHEFRALGLRQRLPGTPEGPERDLPKVEDFVGDLTDSHPTLG